jgi:integrase
MKTKLKNGCSISKLSVSPKNWQTKSAKVSIDWVISYRFYQPDMSKPKQVLIRGMNSFKKLEERQLETTSLIDKEIEKLNSGYNPCNKETEFADAPGTFLNELKTANANITVADRTKRDLRFFIGQCEKAIKELGYEKMICPETSKKYIKAILEKMSTTSDRFNKNRSYLMILLSEMCESETLTANFAKDIRKKKHLKKTRQILNDDERKRVSEYLKAHHKEFYRFLNIFFHSGARISELLRIKAKDVDINNQQFKIILLKGSQYRETFKVIKDLALPYWKELLELSKPDDYLFSKELLPGAVSIQPYQIGKRWYRLVKKRLNIEADFYSLKHLHTTEVSELLNEFEAAKHNSHTSTAMVKRVYDVRSKERANNQLKNLNNSF